MALYLKKIKERKGTQAELLALIPDEHKVEAAALIARVVNNGIVCCPRGVQSTVRLNIVSGLCEDLPVRCTLEERTSDWDSTKTYKALVTREAPMPVAS